MFFLLLHSLLLLRLLSLAVFYHFGVSTFYTNFKIQQKLVVFRRGAGTIPQKVGSITPQVGRIATRSSPDRKLFRIQQNAEASSFCAGQRIKLTALFFDRKSAESW
ncbi:hypothetical protein C6Y45_16360 [Alkalicoccus saliphilus]|uniref:Uncharacterized protein n=1 Tax=Alkalicoccus saliphilus TaxID=200989 RepID=A0A2T4U285_9BACI|nr:hypothetical protein C6Y45_16360 [Alkalicoccus saliphilus]